MHNAHGVFCFFDTRIGVQMCRMGLNMRRLVLENKTPRAFYAGRFLSFEPLGGHPVFGLGEAQGSWAERQCVWEARMPEPCPNGKLPLQQARVPAQLC